MYGANFKTGKVGVWDGNIKAIQNTNAFVDSKAPSGFAPFNIQDLNGKLYITYAKHDDEKMDDAAGADATADNNQSILRKLIPCFLAN